MAVFGSGGLFALAVLQAQQGCDRREPEPEQTTSPASVETPAVAPVKAEPAGAEPKVEPTAAGSTPNAAPEPKPKPKPKNFEPKDRRFFPASKSGGLHVHNPAPAQQQAPNQTDD